LRRPHRARLRFGCLLGALLWITAAAPPQEQVLAIAGDPTRPVKLEVTLFMPPGNGPFPLAVINHGSNGVSTLDHGKRFRAPTATPYFLSRGYAVALPMMRGFAGSGGEIAHAGCDLAAVAHANARDIRAVIEALDQRPDIDRSRVVVAGESFGGWNTLGFGAFAPAGVRGLVLFNAALRTTDCAAQDAAMIGAAARFGHETVLPSLWFYGDNDSVMPVATWREVFAHFTSAGGHADLMDFGTFGTNAHHFLNARETLPVWAPRVDAFLARIGMPWAVVYPDYLKR
jgi:dienelactone hydrolase